jgi:hypothetical protein
MLAVLSALAICAWAPSALQAQTGSVTGTVTDLTGFLEGLHRRPARGYRRTAWRRSWRWRRHGGGGRHGGMQLRHHGADAYAWKNRSA